jgi:uncharacterized protein YkwD
MRLRRPLVILVLAVAALAALVPTASAGSAHSTQSARAFTGALVSAINGARAANGLQPLQVDTRFSAAARGQSIYLASTGGLDHMGPDGASVVTRLARQGFHGQMVGENLAAGMGPAATVAAWLASPGHRMNLLEPQFHRLGVGIAMGSLGGMSAPFVTADFGS